MTNYQFYLLAQAYNSGAYGGEAYQGTGTEPETTTQTGVGAPSTGLLRQDSTIGLGILAAILLVSVMVGIVVLYVKKRTTKGK